jgi:hypothetical protein
MRIWVIKMSVKSFMFNLIDKQKKIGKSISIKHCILLLIFIIPFTLYVSRGFCVDYTSDANCKMAFPMDVDENPLTDSSGNSNTGALKGVGEPDYKTATPPKAYSTGYYNFDGSNDIVTITDSVSLSPSGDFSFVTWVRPETLPTNDYGKGVVNKNYDLSGAGGFYIAAAYESNNNYWESGFAFTGGRGNTIISVNNWYHLGFVYNDAGSPEASAALYLNGVLEHSITSWYEANLDPDNMILGNYCAKFDGDEDEIAFFNDMLTSTEINDIMDNGLVGAAAGGGGFSVDTTYRIMVVN